MRTTAFLLPKSTESTTPSAKKRKKESIQIIGVLGTWEAGFWVSKGIACMRELSQLTGRRPLMCKPGEDANQMDLSDALVTKDFQSLHFKVVVAICLFFIFILRTCCTRILCTNL